ncbi:UDP-3-O-acyl-N-acetylglucosamine deacetylase [Pseudobacteriovorax antillogorgiicola]|uniref:UDP-3-O-acyl-N-acetylglucosamine deacetylase n=1 Tax=Pseudobacteriovorax antillogorgiicola TaxID=1513793 RepID=A0A1Y6B667_9BACT|nr:UDP-3-O-acyl-N-acetylglucosamine deacetylase [Pseudobacteriovorax antillogorgiicola]TCS59264.1 UDP-3-O-[3-hydroxymyristoyl] N-acetylglucosamine deacetylase [Pseudobacteriovorax antillogorgiicola]SME89927.1 UDP-3-O-[3-hydroxymyristoyl] N-acetylglucosamine deacetylase [Pseudobacteriovorax antillogorgiicola]
MGIMTKQTSIQSKVRFTGKGLHCGRIVHLDVLPAKADTGIVFHRNDDPAAEPIQAHAFNITSTALSTTIGLGPSSVSTIEHLMAAFAGLGISNAIVRLNAPEVPIMDGSSKPFVKKLMTAGIRELDKAQKIWKVIKPFEIREGDQFIRIEPSRRQRYQCSIDFPFHMIGKQSVDYWASTENFIRVANARTFCHIKDVNMMKEQGLALGGSLENAIVISDDGLLNAEGLRSQEEFAEHKLLDLIGDMALLGAPFLGDVKVHKPGHALTAKFTKALLENESEYLEAMFISPFVRPKEHVSTASQVFRPAWANLG